MPPPPALLTPHDRPLATPKMAKNRQIDPTPRPRHRRRLAATIIVGALVTVISSGCGTGERPTLVAVEDVTTTPVELELAPAPESVPEIALPDPNFALETSVDDALASWARANNITYRDACVRVVPEPGELCDSPTEADTTRLLGPSADEIWYVVTIDEVTDASIGRGYRVGSITIPGRG